MTKIWLKLILIHFSYQKETDESFWESQLFYVQRLPVWEQWNEIQFNQPPALDECLLENRSWLLKSIYSIVYWHCSIHHIYHTPHMLSVSWSLSLWWWWILLARKWNSSWRYFEWLSWTHLPFDGLGCSRARMLFVWLTRSGLGSLDQHAPVLPSALWGDVTSPLCQSAGSHFFLPAASIHWPHSVSLCSSQGVQEASTYKIKKPLSPQDILRLSGKLFLQ